MRPGTFFYLSLLVKHFVATFGAPQTADKHGRSVAKWRCAQRRQGMVHPRHEHPPAWVTVSSISFGPNSCACEFGGFSRSTDGGATWQSPISIPNSPQWGTLDVATNGNLFIGGGGNSGSRILVSSLDECAEPEQSRPLLTRSLQSTWAAARFRRHGQSRRTCRADVPGSGPLRWPH